MSNSSIANSQTLLEIKLSGEMSRFIIIMSAHQNRASEDARLPLTVSMDPPPPMYAQSFIGIEYVAILLMVQADSTPRELASSGRPKKGRTYIATTSGANGAIGTTHERSTTHMRDNVTASNVQIYHTYMGADPLIHSNIEIPQLSSMPPATAP
ncbi:hypothetical protein H0H92_008588 [Tricholoma furcatifolium]|nr:hypothetical protein H0H92_008588 [Tricholoma furcatifolium]